MTLIFNTVLEVVLFVQNFIKLSAVVHELSCSQCFDNAENNTGSTAVASAGSKNS